MKYKKSKQREKILEILQNTTSHPSADWIYEQLKPDFPNLSMGTVYRNLGILVDQELVKKLDFGSTFDRYDANLHDHYHFLCEKCGKIYDLEPSTDISLKELISNIDKHEVKYYRVEFYGLCEKCK